MLFFFNILMAAFGLTVIPIGTKELLLNWPFAFIGVTIALALLNLPLGFFSGHVLQTKWLEKSIIEF